jgi:hypothetical protein
MSPLIAAQLPGGVKIQHPPSDTAPPSTSYSFVNNDLAPSPRTPRWLACVVLTQCGRPERAVTGFPSCHRTPRRQTFSWVQDANQQHGLERYVTSRR